MCIDQLTDQLIDQLTDQLTNAYQSDYQCLPIRHNHMLNTGLDHPV